MRAFKFTLRVKDCAEVFNADMGPGVLVTQEVVYKTAPETNTPMFLRTLMSQADTIMQDNVEVTFEEITDAD